MSDEPIKKPARLTIKPRVQATSDTDKPRKTASSKTGARAHQRTRRETEQRRTEPVPVPRTTGNDDRQTASLTKPKREPDQYSAQRDGQRDGPRDGQRNSARRPGHRQSDRTPARRADADFGADRVPTAFSTVGDAPDASEIFRMFASCPRGLEHALADELSALGLSDVQPGQAGCRFRGNWFDMWRANLHSRLATRVLVQLAHAKVTREDDLRALAMSVNWERWLGAEKTLRVDTSAIRSPMQSLQYCNLLVKDSICDRLRDKEGSRPSIDTVRPDVRVHSFLAQDSATLYLDTSGESLFKRGWRLDKAEAPIRENLAAGLLAISGWQPEQPLFDPFCGSGTILIEAAWMALNIPPGINRPFAFERLRAHDASGWQSLRRQATDAARHELPAPIIGSDLSPRAIEAAKLNTQRAGLNPAMIDWQVADARHVVAPTQSGMIVTNPPYGERLDVEADLMQQWATQLKQRFTGWQVNIISADHALPSALRLKPKRRVPLFNGALDCRMFIFDMVNAQYDPKGQ